MLTERECEALEGAARGESNEQTGRRVFLSHNTVKRYRQNAITKLDAKNVTHAVAVAIRGGYIECPPEKRQEAS